MRNVTRDLRSFSRPDDETVSAVELRAVVRAVLELVRKEIEARARLVLDLRRHAGGAGQRGPPGAGGAEPAGQRLAGAGARRPRAPRDRPVAPSATGTDDAIIEVWDSGPGVAAENRERIFEPFFTTKPVGQGTGLGLFVCRNIVTGFGGEIAVRDRPGGGSVFRVSLPAAGARRAQVDPAAGTPSARRHRPAGRPGPASWSSTTTNGSAAPWSSACATTSRPAPSRTAARAVQLILTGPGFDLVFCDLVMRGLTGMDIFQRVRAADPALLPRLVFMTGGAFTPRRIGLRRASTRTPWCTSRSTSSARPVAGWPPCPGVPADTLPWPSC